jgi:hypothetical protein
MSATARRPCARPPLLRIIMPKPRFHRSETLTPPHSTHPPNPLQQLRAAHAQKAGAAQDRTASGRTVSGRPTSAGQAHGHKGHLLFRHLPEVETKAQ